MKTIAAKQEGINWIHYALIQFDDNGTARFLKEWRAHKFDDNQRGRHLKTRVEYDAFWNPVDIAAWRADGSPGGIVGLKAKYIKPSKLAIVWQNRERVLYDLRKSND